MTVHMLHLSIVFFSGDSFFFPSLSLQQERSVARMSVDLTQRGRSHEPERKMKQIQALGRSSENICGITDVSTHQMPHHPNIHHSQQVMVDEMCWL